MANQVMGDLLLGHLIHHRLQATMVARTIINTKADPTVTIVSRRLPLTEDTEVGEVDMGHILSRKRTAETLAMEEALVMDMGAMGTLAVADQVMEAMGAIEGADLLGMVVLAVVVVVVMPNHKEITVAMDVEALPVLTTGEDVVTVGTRRRFIQYCTFYLCN